MDISDLAPPKGDAIDLKAVGDKLDGIVEHVGEWREITGQYGTKTKAPINLVIDGATRTLWLPKGSRMATVIAEAVRAAGATAFLKGGRLQLARVADVPVGKGNPMHDFVAKYTPPATSGGMTADDLF